jgi:hypothetical protein
MRTSRLAILLVVCFVTGLQALSQNPTPTPKQSVKSPVSGVVTTNPGTLKLPPSPPPSFVVYSHQGRHRCLDYTPEVAGSPIFINDCTVAHQIVVQEINEQHDVILHAGTKMIGVKMPNQNTFSTGAAAGPAPISPAGTTTEYPLELQNQLTPAQQILPSSVNQRFALDGDSIIFASNRTMVAKVENARGAIRTPIVLGDRHLADNEFWDFLASDGIDRDPTSGFVRIGYPGDPCANFGSSDPRSCVARFFAVIQNAGPGTVVKLGTSLDFTGQPQLNVGGSQTPPVCCITIRGDRRGTSMGPEIAASYTKPQKPIDVLIMIPEGINDVRFTGLRLRGPSRSSDQNQTEAFGLLTFDSGLRNIADHNDISDWPNVGIMVKGDDSPNATQFPNGCDPAAVNDPTVRPTSASVVRNFIHNNEMQDGGYGVEAAWGAYPFIEGNTFVSNRHSIAAGHGSAHTGYRAWSNLVLSTAPLQHGHLDWPFHTQDFDMHGTGDNGFGGRGGDFIDIFKNTFLGDNRPNFELRGIPCNFAQFHNNISIQGKDDAVQFKVSEGILAVAIANADKLLRISASPNQFDHNNIAYGSSVRALSSGQGNLGVGDFDGDGTDDLFLATGEGWYYSPSGSVAWRFLSNKTETLDQLLFGDFDGDGRTDVVTIHGGTLVVSWGGVSEWEVLNTHLAPGAIADMATGNFIGDSRSDIFFADGKTWFVSDAGSGPFVIVQTSSFRVKDLRFGDFNGDGRTDVFGVGSKNWQVSFSPTSGTGLFSSWHTLRAKLTDNVDGLIVADFNGDGIADVGSNHDGPGWRISFGGFENWKDFYQPFGLAGPQLAGVGHFTGRVVSDVLSWNIFNKYVMCDANVGQNTQLCISHAGITPVQRYSTQDMR